MKYSSYYTPRMIKIIVTIAISLIIIGLALTGVPSLKNDLLYSIDWFAANVVGVGVISAGVFSVGVFSAGVFSVGIFSIGVFSFGIFSLGTFSFALAFYLMQRNRNKRSKNVS